MDRKTDEWYTDKWLIDWKGRKRLFSLTPDIIICIENPKECIFKLLKLIQI